VVIMSRHRFCHTNDRDAFIEELAEEIWDERQVGRDAGAWAQADPQVRLEFRKMAADTLRFLEHGHG
jgi:hypothetical protein